MSRSWTHESHSAWWASALMATCPGGASAVERHPSSSSDSSAASSASVDATKRSSTSASGIAALASTSCAGTDTGSNPSRKRVGDRLVRR